LNGSFSTINGSVENGTYPFSNDTAKFPIDDGSDKGFRFRFSEGSLNSFLNVSYGIYEHWNRTVFYNITNDKCPPIPQASLDSEKYHNTIPRTEEMDDLIRSMLPLNAFGPDDLGDEISCDDLFKNNKTKEVGIEFRLKVLGGAVLGTDDNSGDKIGLQADVNVKGYLHLPGPDGLPANESTYFFEFNARAADVAFMVSTDGWNVTIADTFCRYVGGIEMIYSAFEYMKVD
jgi:hypothetical protein